MCVRVCVSVKWVSPHRWVLLSFRRVCVSVCVLANDGKSLSLSRLFRSGHHHQIDMTPSHAYRIHTRRPSAATRRPCAPSTRIRPSWTTTIRSTMRSARDPPASTRRAPTIRSHRHPLAADRHRRPPMPTPPVHRRRRTDLPAVAPPPAAHRSQPLSCSAARRSWTARRPNWSGARRSCATARRRRVATIGRRSRRSAASSRASIKTSTSRFRWSSSASYGICTTCGRVSN